jgi:hypothetical protein
LATEDTPSRFFANAGTFALLKSVTLVMWYFS